MTSRPAEVTKVHTRLLRCALEVENSRAYWQHTAECSGPLTARQAFDEYWFGARSLERTELLMVNFRVRFDAYPEAVRVLRGWRDMDPGTRRLICHWHVQLADPLYRAFTGNFLVERHESLEPVVTHNMAVKWVANVGPATWATTTQINYASKLLSSAHAAGLLGAKRDSRPVLFPKVGDDALAYLLYLLKDVQIAGTLLENPYLASVGLSGGVVEERLRSLPDLHFRRQGNLVDWDWEFESLIEWARNRQPERDAVHAGSGV